MTRLPLAAALVAAVFLSPLPTAADARFARLSQPGIVAILHHAFPPGTGEATVASLAVRRGRVRRERVRKPRGRDA